MHSETQLAIVAAFAGFLLKTFLGFCICWAISKVVVSPRRKFLVWFAFLALSGCYWLSLIFSFIPHTASELLLSVPAVASSEAVARWQMPPSWTYPLPIVERILGGLYLIALGYFLLMRIRKQLRLRWVLHFAYKAPDHIESMFRSIAIDSGAKKIQLLVLSGIYSPATFGWIHPVVLLPPLCLEQDESELADIFRHELQHVARHDFVFNNVAGFCKALLFFHPALWYAMRKMELESELACDLAVVRNSPERRATYAECLVRFARLHAAQDPTPWNLDFAGSSIQLKVRVRSVLTETAKIPAWLSGLRTSMGMLLFAGFLFTAPSLCIVLSYAHRAAQPIVPSLISSRAAVRPRKRSFLRGQEQQKLVRTLGTSAVSPAVPAPVTRSEASLGPAARVTHQPDTLSSREPVPTLQQRGAGGSGIAFKPAQATVVLISNPSSVTAGSQSSTKGRSIASAFMTGASEAVRFAGSHGKDIH
jgi:beta-lactamase regulating signal transducer with metallopeptidase domain